MSNSLKNWFSRKDSRLKLLSPLQELNQNREEWNSSMLTLVNVKDDQAEQLQKAVNVSYDYSFADANEKILQLSTEYGATHATAQGNMMVSLHALKELSVERESSGIRKAAAGTQRLLTSAGKFLQSFSGIAELVKAADQQLGGLAYGTVMVLTMIAVKKTEHEELIEEVLEELAYAFPRLNILEYIEPRDSIRCLVIGAFELTIKFCRQATVYCALSSLRRVREATMKDEMLKIVSRLRIKLSEIHKECEIIMIQRLEEISKTLDATRAKVEEVAMETSDSKILLQDVHTRGKDIHATGEDTNIRVKEGQAWMERHERSKAQKAYLAKLRKTLELKDLISTADVCLRVDDLLQRLSDNQEQRGRCAKPMSFDLLKEDRTFWGWYRSSRSSVLVLGGHNFIRDYEDDPEIANEMSWLSFASVWFAKESVRHCDRTLSYFGQLNYTVRSHDRQSFWYVVRTLIYHLAQTLPEDFMDKHENIISETDMSGWNDADCAEAIEQMVGLLIKLLRDLPEDASIAIVIDRLDQCQWGKFKEKRVDGMGHAVQFLLQLVRDHCLRHLNIKILLVMSNYSALRVARMQDWARGEGIEWRTEWDQEAEN